MLLLILMPALIGLISADSCKFSMAKEYLSLATRALDLMKEACENSETKPGYPRMLNPGNCAEVLALGFTQSGVYKIHPKWNKNVQPFDVYCDQKTDGGGWTVFQRRGDYANPNDYFFRNWTDYRNGFGNLYKEFWLGNDYISLLTTQDRMQIRVDLEDFENSSRFAIYNNFLVLDETRSFLMTLSGYQGNAGDGLTSQNGQTFATVDKDTNDCASKFHGAWWYANCHSSNLNGLYLKGKHETYADGVNWEPFKGHHYSLMRTEMKVRPEFFTTVSPQ